MIIQPYLKNKNKSEYQNAYDLLSNKENIKTASMLMTHGNIPKSDIFSSHPFINHDLDTSISRYIYHYDAVSNKVTVPSIKQVFSSNNMSSRGGVYITCPFISYAIRGVLCYKHSVEVKSSRNNNARYVPLDGCFRLDISNNIDLSFFLSMSNDEFDVILGSDTHYLEIAKAVVVQNFKKSSHIGITTRAPDIDSLKNQFMSSSLQETQEALV
jgi:hypothetical protein